MVLVGLSCEKKEPPVEKKSPLPSLQAGTIIKVGDNPISIGHTASPEVVDWNNDGKKDLLVGTFENGRIMLFLNQGTDEKPVFDGGEFLTAAADEINVGYG